MVAVERGREVTVRGRTEAKRSVDLRAETSGRVVEILVKKGAVVRQGDVIVRIAMDDREARLAKAVARVRQRELEFNASQRLNERGFRSATKMAEAAAEFDEAMAYQAQVEIDISNTKVSSSTKPWLTRRRSRSTSAIPKWRRPSRGSSRRGRSRWAMCSRKARWSRASSIRTRFW